MPIEENVTSAYVCDYCSYRAIRVVPSAKTSYEIDFLCGGCGKRARYAHALSETPSHNELRRGQKLINHLRKQLGADSDEEIRRYIFYMSDAELNEIFNK